eukprot:CAMPEP_0197287412 /NCGR_PEP_ID=MMETSP0890-20130614/3720_1 /TAXON_ID=44058 ORGANISM="Aureoumbra lagunensis, Strain CCMP1510" /NCGR_SAMPLE_ID=MMETSP0890 /ASSEMBLY_ACC=CAM_ASM_000533 /LENGTH=76 /DNA_ID=CAMNT_0042756997 /DNA_START=88 /DNA_END=318 /DNA_ORIENTATION=+
MNFVIDYHGTAGITNYSDTGVDADERVVGNSFNRSITLRQLRDSRPHNGKSLWDSTENQLLTIVEIKTHRICYHLT